MLPFLAIFCLFVSTISAASVCPDIGMDFLPHETDCNKYYECSDGTKFLFSCPAGLHFNPTIKNCDYPEHAGCDPSFIKCNGGDPQYKPHPTDCSKFVECGNGLPNIQSCPAGLHWNQKILSCDLPENAGCQK